MKKNIKHRNILKYTEKNNSELKTYEFPCRGCTITRDREIQWHNYASSISGTTNQEIDNSYLFLEEEPSNKYDPNAIAVVVGGEFFGTMGYVGKEFTGEVKKILTSCSSYRLDMKDKSQLGEKAVELVMTRKKRQ